MKQVTTQQGDTWDILSKRLYNTERYADLLIKANLQHRYRVIFPSGIVLNAPDITPSVSEIDDSLPPWKR